ncbi:hypothetical protein P7K49_006083, partial [Saguinus oedipus]
LDRAMCVVSPRPTPPPPSHPARGPGGRESEGTGLRGPAPGQGSALLRDALREAAFFSQA